MRKRYIIFRLRLLLFRVAIAKNISTILASFFVVFILASMAGIIPKEIPFFGSLSTDARLWYIQTFNVDNSTFFTVSGIITAILSSSFIYGYVKKTVKRITLQDVGSEKVKKLLRSVNLDLDVDGHIVQMLEEKTNLDLNNDGKIKTRDIVDKVFIKDSPIEDIIIAVDEMRIIAKLDLKTIVEENADTFNLTKKEESPSAENKTESVEADNSKKETIVKAVSHEDAYLREIRKNRV